MFLEILILGNLAVRPAHGYEIKQRVTRNTGSTVSLNNNVLYPALHRFEEMGAVHSELVPQQGSPPRRVYSMTEAGLDVLRGMIEDFPPEQASSEAEFSTRFAYFDLIEPPQRIEILAKRVHALHRLAGFLREVLPDTWANRSPYAGRLVQFKLDQTLDELRWLEQQLEDQEAR